MSGLTSLARTKAERKGGPSGEINAVSQRDKFPWGLSLTLEKESLEKLGREVGDFQVGATVDLVCKARVTRVSSSEGEDGADATVGLQIESMALRTGKDKERTAFGKVFGDEKS